MAKSARKAMRSLMSLAIGAFVMLFALQFNLTEKLGVALYDSRMKVLSRNKANSEQNIPIALIAIDQSSLDWVQKQFGLGWPWPRELYGVIAAHLQDARAQAWDILFTEPSTFGPEDDARCAQAMSSAGNVILATLEDRMPVVRGQNLSFGHVVAEVDSDGICRGYKIALKSEHGLLPSLGLQAVDVALRDKYSSSKPAKKLPPRDTTQLLRFWGSSRFERYSAAQIIAAAIGNEENGRAATREIDMKGKIAVIGITAPGLMDRQATPIDPALPGMEVHANFIADAFAGTFIKRVPGWIEILLALGGVSAASFLFLFRKKVIALIGIPTLMLLPIAASFLLFDKLYFFNPMPALIGELSACIAVVVLEYRSEGRQRAYLRRAFAQYVSNDVISVIVNQPEKLSLGGESRIITTLFSDLEGFTHVSELLGAEQLARFMNKYLGIISEEILALGGTLDKYMGDAVVAFWNAPLNIEDHAARALAAAMRIQRKMSASSQSFEQEFGIIPHTRIGIATGFAVVGNLGSSARFAYTAVGDSVNIASRLEAANKTVGTTILTMRDTVAAAAGNEKISSSTEHISLNLSGNESVSLLKLGFAIVQGKTLPIELWTIEDTFECTKNRDDYPRPWSEIRQLPK